MHLSFAVNEMQLKSVNKKIRTITFVHTRFSRAIASGRELYSKEIRRTNWTEHTCVTGERRAAHALKDSNNSKDFGPRESVCRACTLSVRCRYYWYTLSLFSDCILVRARLCAVSFIPSLAGVTPQPDDPPPGPVQPPAAPVARFSWQRIDNSCLHNRVTDEGQMMPTVRLMNVITQSHLEKLDYRNVSDCHHCGSEEDTPGADDSLDSSSPDTDDGTIDR